jgi:hypothetical protein
MVMKDQLIFDVTSAATILDSDNVGAFVRAGSDGQRITWTNDGASKAIFFGQVAGMTTDIQIMSNVAGVIANNIVLTANGTDTVSTMLSTWNSANGSNPCYLNAGDGSQIPTENIQLTGGSDNQDGLDVNVINPIVVTALELDIRDLAFASDKVDVSGSEVSLDAATLAALETINAVQSGTWDIGTLTSITNDVNIADGGNSITVDASQLDIDDLNATDDAIQSWLFDGAGTALTSTLVGSDQALDVNVVGGLNVEVDLSHVDDSVRLGDGTDFFTSTTIGSDIGLDVNIINDPTTQNTAILSKADTLAAGGTAEKVVSANLANRKALFVYNVSNRKVYIGASDVTAANGFPLSPGSYLEIKAGASVDVYYNGEADGQEIRTLEMS